MATQDKKSLLTEIAALKKELMMLRIKITSGESVAVKEFKDKRKAVARLFTKINSNNKEEN